MWMYLPYKNNDNAMYPSEYFKKGLTFINEKIPYLGAITTDIALLCRTKIAVKIAVL